MKIGIITMHRVINYGSFLQAYSLKEVLEKMGHDVVFIDYKPGKPVVPYDKKAYFKGKIKNNPTLSRMITTVRNKTKGPDSFYNFADKYSQEYLKMLGVGNKYEYHTPVDAVIIGSDEVFNCLQPNANVGFTGELFGQNQNTKKKMSYAASFGYTTYNKLDDLKLTDTIKNWLSDFQSLSIRDTNSKEILEKMGFDNVSKNVDPVFLGEYEGLVPEETDLTDYIIVYTYSGRKYTQEQEQMIMDFAKNNNKKIVTIGKHKEWSDIKLQANPFEMITYFKNADFVFTDTFHGSVFSIKYNVPFSTLIREDNKQKLGDLLRTFQLESRKIENLSELENMYKTPVDFTTANQIIIENKEKSIQYLRNNLEA